ncbi:unnamed protein product, partial [Aphanomyces euteiches]
MKSALVWSCLAGLAAAQSNFDCGNLFACTAPDGSFVECQNPARRGCCKGLPYWLYNTTDGITTLQACCEDAKGNPFISLGGCPTTTPTTAAPTPAPTPATTPACGNLFACTTPDGTLVECINLARRGCCKGLPYWYYNTTDGITTLNACCEDAKGNPFINLGGCPTTTPTTIKPTTATNPAPTPASSPAATTPAPTPASSPAATTPTPESVCGNLVPCTLPNGTLVECQNPNHRKCCKGLPYWVYVTSGGNTIY